VKRRYKLSILALIVLTSPFWTPFAFLLGKVCDSGCGPPALWGFAKGVALVGGVIGALIWAVSMDSLS
jgi:hypothetical protein